jgi:long-chain acyl-CoA synthetase
MVRTVTTAGKRFIRMTDTMQDKPWTCLYGAHVPHRVTAKFATMVDLFRDAVARNPDAPALVYFDSTTDYADLNEQSDAFAVWLQARGVGRGDRVQVIAQNIPAFPVACLAAWKLGAVIVPGNPMYRAAELGQILADSEPSAILCQDLEIDAVREGMAIAGLSEIPLVIASPVEGVAEGYRYCVPTSRTSCSGVTLPDIVEQHRGEVPAPIKLSSGDLGLILYTSGTTGKPKGAMITHGNMTFNAETTQLWFALGEKDRILALAPFFHITGFICHIAAAFRAGCAMIMNYRFEPSLALRMIREQRPTCTVAAITAFNALMNATGASAKDFRSLEKVWSGGAPIAPALLEEIRQKTGIAIHNAYGMTEVTSPVILAPHGVPMPVHDGVLPLGIPIPSTDIMIVDDDGRELGFGESGEIVARGPQVMAGYWRNPTESAASLNDGWMHTGDVGFRNAAGWIYLIDRKKDMIIASGFKVWPREVEDVLHEHPAVHEAAVVGVPDSYRGETVKAYVSLKSGHLASSDLLTDHCRQRLAAYKVPRIIEIMDELPKTVTGKIQRAALREGCS